MDNQQVNPQSSTPAVKPVEPVLTAQKPQSAAVPVQNPSNPTGFFSTEIEELQKKINSVSLPADLKQKAEGMIQRLQRMLMQSNFSDEFEPIAEYINWITQLPWGKYTQDNLDMKHAQESLQKYHYGLEPVKKRIMEYLAIIHLRAMNDLDSMIVKDVKAVANTNTSASPAQTNMGNGEMKRLQGSSEHAPILCFVGIQGVGKTSMAKSIAIALNREFVRVSLGALGSVQEIRGRSRGMVDAEPGQIIKSLIRTQTMNPLILLDEIDKVSSETGLRADVMAALLEILDPEQNSTFMDKYVDYPVDLSKCMFITTANNLGGISAALLDRLEIIRFGSYTDEEKMQIAKDYMLPKVRNATGLTQGQLDFADDVWPLVVRPLGFDAGVRQLERTLTDLARKVALQIVNGTSNGVKITKENFREFIPEDFGVYS